MEAILFEIILVFISNILMAVLLSAKKYDYYEIVLGWIDYASLCYNDFCICNHKKLNNVN